MKFGNYSIPLQLNVKKKKGNISVASHCSCFERRFHVTEKTEEE